MIFSFYSTINYDYFTILVYEFIRPIIISSRRAAGAAAAGGPSLLARVVLVGWRPAGAGAAGDPVDPELTDEARTRSRC